MSALRNHLSLAAVGAKPRCAPRLYVQFYSRASTAQKNLSHIKAPSDTVAKDAYIET